MQIKSVQSPNFGMAMKIDPQAKIRLKEKPIDYIRELNKLGHEFKNYKHADLCLNEDLVPFVYKRSTDDYYFGKFTPTKTYKCGKVEVETTTLLGPEELYLHTDGYSQGTDVMKSLQYAEQKGPIQSAAEFVRQLEASEEYVLKNSAKIQAKQNVVDEAIDELLSNFNHN